ncbi:PREDICTED: PDZ domain-containing protein GIPC1, partial [Ceratosolen solmsi marchali]|uniref:PDZ domain-containing protein GIPC1 n=1 Tax=Ceratosolen solmsi marchali TaxID=326594 RepID=A0AAJ7DWJ5_9HYME
QQQQQQQHQQQQQQHQQQQQPQLAFYCQLAHGSATGLISGFGNVRELYCKIAKCFDIRPEEILFCTLNTHKIEMSELVGGQIGLDDFIFAHKKGRAKEIELIKTEDALGLTLTDNGAGYVFIKRIKENSIMDRLRVVQIGDHIEKLNGISLVGKRHYEVARMLKEITRGATLVLRLVEPLSRSGFGIIGPRCAGPRSRGKFCSYGNGRETLRFKADGMAKIEQVNEDDKSREKIEKINNALDIYMGISDVVLARRLWEIAQNKINSMDVAKAIDSSMPDSYNFPEDFIFDVWKIAFEARNH